MSIYYLTGGIINPMYVYFYYSNKTIPFEDMSHLESLYGDNLKLIYYETPDYNLSYKTISKYLEQWRTHSSCNFYYLTENSLSNIIKDKLNLTPILFNNSDDSDESEKSAKSNNSEQLNNSDNEDNSENSDE